MYNKPDVTISPLKEKFATHSFTGSSPGGPGRISVVINNLYLKSLLNSETSD